MAIKFKHEDIYSMYFCTFSCYEWIPLFALTNGYDLVYKWFDVLRQKGHDTIAYVIMPNHLHTISYFPEPGFNLNTIISNAKRFMAYKIVERLKADNQFQLLNRLSSAVSPREKSRGQLHKVFNASFDAKSIYSNYFFQQKLNYIHQNPVRGKWQLADHYTTYEHSSASFYELGIVNRFQPLDYRLL